jgi:hypothetical protein
VVPSGRFWRNRTLLGGRYSSGTCNRIFFAGATPLSSERGRQRELIPLTGKTTSNAPRKDGAGKGRYASSTTSSPARILASCFRRRGLSLLLISARASARLNEQGGIQAKTTTRSSALRLP